MDQNFRGLTVAKRQLSRSIWDTIGSFIWSFEFARVSPLVSKGFRQALDSAPIWRQAWDDLVIRREKMLKYASGTIWDYDVDDEAKVAEDAKNDDEEDRGFRDVVAESEALFEQDVSPSLESDEDLGSDDEVLDCKATPRRENVIVPGGYVCEPRPWRWTGCGVVDEARWSNAVGVDELQIVETPHPRELLGKSQEAAFWFRLRKALQEWADNDTADDAKADALRAIAARVRCVSFVTCEGVSEDYVVERDSIGLYGSKCHAISVVEVGSVIIRIFCVPQLVIETPDTTDVYESFVVAFKDLHETEPRWRYPVDFDTAAGRVIDGHLSAHGPSTVFRQDLLEVLNEALLRTCSLAPSLFDPDDGLRLSFLFAGVQPKIGGAFISPRYFIAWTESLRAVKNGDYDFDGGGVVYGTLQEALFGAASHRWRNVVATETPDLRSFTSLLVFDALADDLRHTWSVSNNVGTHHRRRGPGTIAPMPRIRQQHTGGWGLLRRESRGGLFRLGALLIRPFWHNPDDVVPEDDDFGEFGCDVPPRLARRLIAARTMESLDDEPPTP